MTVSRLKVLRISEYTRSFHVNRAFLTVFSTVSARCADSVEYAESSRILELERDTPAGPASAPSRIAGVASIGADGPPASKSNSLDPYAAAAPAPCET